MKEKKNILELTRISCADYRAARKMPLTLVADNVRSMLNIGSMLRTADAFMVRRMIMCGISGVPPHPEISKTALGAEESVAWSHEDDTLQCVERLRGEGACICVLEQAHDSVSLADFEPEPDREYVLVVGNEVEGVDQRVVDSADLVLEIPQHGVKHSLNVSVSAALGIWAFYRPWQSRHRDAPR